MDDTKSTLLLLCSVATLVLTLFVLQSLNGLQATIHQLKPQQQQQHQEQQKEQRKPLENLLRKREVSYKPNNLTIEELLPGGWDE